VTAPTRLRPADIGKPLLRGWLHTYAFFVALIAGVVLTTLAATVAPRPGTAAAVACGIYSVTVCALFGTSALYHRRVWSERWYPVMRRLDHSMIFVFIAGTYTAFSVLLLRPAMATVILAVVWGGAALGVGLKLIYPHTPRWVFAPLYIALGWVAVAVLPQLLAHGVTGFALLLAGGAWYTVGALSYVLRRPNPWPGVFGHHEFFHACTVIAAACHHIAIYFALFA
jgi:hemolysin III